MKATLPKQLIGERTVIVNYEMEYRESDLDLAVCVEITGGLAKTFGYEEKTLTFTDNGLGMTAEEVEEYINQIAFSGATDFLEKYKDKKQVIIFKSHKEADDFLEKLQ